MSRMATCRLLNCLLHTGSALRSHRQSFAYSVSSEMEPPLPPFPGTWHLPGRYSYRGPARLMDMCGPGNFFPVNGGTTTLFPRWHVA